MKRKNVLDQAQRILDQCSLKKPEFLNVPQDEWDIAQPETKHLLLQIERMRQPLENAYWQAVEREDWYRALIVYQRMFSHPYPPSISPLLHSKRECKEREGRFVSQTNEWLTDIKDLLHY